MLRAGVTESRKIDTLEQSLTRAKKDWRHRDVHFVDQALAQILLNDIDSATQTYVFSSRGFTGPGQRSSNAIRHEMEGGSAFHDQRRTCMVGQHENGDLIHGVFAPPSAPALVRPGSANGAEHVSTQDPRADVPEASSGVVVIDATSRSGFPAKHRPLKRPSGEGPTVE